MIPKSCCRTKALILIAMLVVAEGSRIRSATQEDRSRAAHGIKPSTALGRWLSSVEVTSGAVRLSGGLEAPVVPPKSLDADASDLVWYIGIGSMMSPIGLGMRNIHPVQSVLCEIQDHRKVFYANEGMATLVPQDGAVCQAVAHQITRAELAILEAREPPSVPVSVWLRGDAPGNVMVQGVSSVAANFVFLEGVHAQPDQVKAKIEQEGSGARGRITMVTKEGIHISSFGSPGFDTTGVVKIGDEPANVPLRVSRVPPVPCKPSARYLELMIEGARAVGMDEAEVVKLAATPCIPRKSTNELKKLPFDSTVTDRLFSIADVQNDDTLRVIRGMVFQLPKRKQSFGKAGSDLALMIATQMRDPLYGIPPSDATEEWDGWPFVEDMLCNFMPEDMKHVGWIEVDRPRRQPGTA